MTVQARVRVASIEEVQAAVQDAHHPLLARGGGTKGALSTTTGATILDLAGLRGILEYEPGEYTFTALAGTPLASIHAALAEHGQYLPFDPPLVAEGATLGGTIAAGLSGAGRVRYGGVRDFLIGVCFVDGQGRLVRGGGKVVKNAAGFDLPKLMVGSLGRLGVLVEVSFKVFPRPAAYGTLQAKLATMADAVVALEKLAAAPLDLEGLDCAPAADGQGIMLWVRLAGLPATLPPRLAQVAALLDQGAPLSDEDEAAHWSAVRSLAWRTQTPFFVKVATTPGKLVALDAGLAAAGASRHYSVGGNLAWIGWSHALDELDGVLRQHELAGLVLEGVASRPLIGRQLGGALLARIKPTLDPAARFPEF